MARRYDSRTTIFSPEGRLYQVEYAMEAISHAGMAMGILAKDGVVLAAAKSVTSKLLEQINHEKIYLISDTMACVVAGITSDANTLVDYVRHQAQKHLLTFNEDVPVEQLVQKMCDLKQGYTQYGGLRPFGVSFLYAGYDDIHGFQLYHSDPSGNYAGWMATCIGQNSTNAQALLKQDYKEEGITLKEAKSLAVKVLAKTLDSASLNGEKLEFGTLQKDAQGKVTFHPYSTADIDQLLKDENVQAIQEQQQQE